MDATNGDGERDRPGNGDGRRKSEWTNRGTSWPIRDKRAGSGFSDWQVAAERVISESDSLDLRELEDMLDWLENH